MKTKKVESQNKIVVEKYRRNFGVNGFIGALKLEKLKDEQISVPGDQTPPEPLPGQTSAGFMKKYDKIRRALDAKPMVTASKVNSKQVSKKGSQLQ